MTTLKVRDRTNGKIKDVQVDAEDHVRLSGYNYLTDKNSDEPFREVVTPDGKRPRIALKRDVMGFEIGDPRRVCYVDKDNVLDCRRSNLKTKSEEKKSEEKKPKGSKKSMVKMVKPINIKTTETKTKTETKVEDATPPLSPVETENDNVLVASSECETEKVCTQSTPNDLDVKRKLLSQIGDEKILEMISMDMLLSAWAETHGYERKQA